MPSTHRDQRYLMSDLLYLGLIVLLCAALFILLRGAERL